jgi:dimethylargininase
MLRAFTRAVSTCIGDCELTFRDRETIDYEQAVRQHDEYCGLLRDHGIEVTKLNASDTLPDCCFVEDTAIIVDEVGIITSMGAASRRSETLLIEQELSRFREIKHIRLPAKLEGGDVVRLGKKVFVGLSSRTNAEGVEALKKILEPFGYHVIPVKVKGSLHLSTACSAINEETVLTNPRWIDQEAFKSVNVLTIPEDEPWAANTLRINGTLCVEAGVPRTIDLVSGLAKKVEVLNISEFRKAEGSLSCLSIIFRGEPGSSVLASRVN